MDDTPVRKLFRDGSGNPLELVKGEEEIFLAVAKKLNKRIWLTAPTQYGKSMTIALALILRATTQKEKWAVISGTEKKTKIIMNYVINHLFDNPIFYSQLVIDIPLERLKRERSKNRLTFKQGGEIFILSAQITKRQEVYDALTGFGAENVILDDSALLSDEHYAMVKRMLGGKENNFIIEMGNPFRRNHFYRTFRSPAYKKIFIPLQQAIQEGRFTQEFIDEMRKEAFFKILYECRFPDENEIDEAGYSALIDGELLQSSYIKDYQSNGATKIMGIDIARGGNKNAFVIREHNQAKVVLKDRQPDTMSTCGKIIEVVKGELMRFENVFIDDIGIGGGVTDRLHEQGFNVQGIQVGERAMNFERFINKRAEMYFETKAWLENGGLLLFDEDFEDLKDIKYKIESSGKMKIMPKDEMIKRGLSSPDVCDALALTFSVPQTWIEQQTRGDFKVSEVGSITKEIMEGI